MSTRQFSNHVIPLLQVNIVLYHTGSWKWLSFLFFQGLLRRNNNHTEPKVDPNKKLDPFFFQECVYYLSNYGSHTANIAFYMKHSNMTEVIRYCYDNLVDKETFTESVYMDCLKKDKVNELFNAMSEMDSTLDMFAVSVG